MRESKKSEGGGAFKAPPLESYRANGQYNNSQQIHECNLTSDRLKYLTAIKMCSFIQNN